MFTTGSKFFYGLSIVAFVAAAAYGWTTGGDGLGPLSVGYKGGVGDHLGYALLMGVFFASAFLGGVAFFTRDGEAETLARIAGTEQVPQVTPPTAPSYWGALTAFGLACLMLGVAISQVFLYLGIAVIGVVAVEWMALAWSDRATGDPETNRAVRDRLLGPIEIPMLAALGIATIMIGLSRILLANSKTGAVVAGAIVATLIFGGANVLAQTNAPRRYVSAAVAALGVLVIGGGIVGAIIGEHEIDHGGEEHHDEGDSTEEEGLPALGGFSIDG